MSDELIKIPEFLAQNKAVSVTAASCSDFCEIACETSIMGNCGTIACQTAAQGGCSTCETVCQICMTTCELLCMSACEVACQGTCLITGQCTNPCQLGCQSACESSSQYPTPVSYGTLTVTGTTDTTVSVSFTSISHSDYYEVVWRNASETALLGSANVYGLSYTITGLTPDAQYAINYRGKNQYGTGPFMPSPVLATTSSALTIYIGNGSTWEAYTAYIGNGTTWEQYSGKIGNGSTWDT